MVFFMVLALTTTGKHVPLLAFSGSFTIEWEKEHACAVWALAGAGCECGLCLAGKCFAGQDDID